MTEKKKQLIKRIAISVVAFGVIGTVGYFLFKKIQDASNSGKVKDPLTGDYVNDPDNYNRFLKDHPNGVFMYSPSDSTTVTGFKAEDIPLNQLLLKYGPEGSVTPPSGSTTN